MLPLVLAFGSGMGWGSADFLAGTAARRLPLLTVSLVSQVAGFAFLLAVVLVRGEAPTETRALVLGLIAGLVGVAGLAALYRGLAIGRMSIVAPTAALSGVVPVAWGLLRGDRPSALQFVGVAIAIAGVVLASRTPDEEGGTERAAGIGLALIAAATLGVLVVLLDEAGRSDPLWGALMIRVSAIAVLLVAVAIRRPSLRMTRRDAGRLGAVGLLDNGANLSFAIAAETGGLLTLTSVLGSLYPVATVLLARFVLHERLARHQTLGVIAALTGVVLIAAG
jgi:drug/metabolite transporter (DMT)-like permease